VLLKRQQWHIFYQFLVSSWGNIFLDELITLSVIVGCATILIGVFLATSKKIKKLEGEARAK